MTCWSLFSEHGQQTALSQTERQFRERRGKVVSVTRHSANPLRAHADAVAARVRARRAARTSSRCCTSPSLQHLLDLIFVMLCEEGDERLEHLTPTSSVRNAFTNPEHAMSPTARVLAGLLSGAALGIVLTGFQPSLAPGCGERGPAHR